VSEPLSETRLLRAAFSLSLGAPVGKPAEPKTGTRREGGMPLPDDNLCTIFGHLSHPQVISADRGPHNHAVPAPPDPIRSVC